jgi:hypothetical protein
MNFPLLLHFTCNCHFQQRTHSRTDFDNSLLQNLVNTLLYLLVLVLNWTAFTLSYKPWSLTLEMQHCVLLHVVSRRSHGPSLLLRDPAFIASPSSTQRRTKRGGGEAWLGTEKTSLTSVAQSHFEVSAFQQFPLGAITPQYYTLCELFVCSGCWLCSLYAGVWRIYGWVSWLELTMD